MLINKYVYDSHDLLAVGDTPANRAWTSSELDDFEDAFTTGTTLHDNAAAILRLLNEFLVNDNHEIVYSEKNSMDDGYLPINEGDPANVMIVDNADIRKFYIDFFQFLMETADVYTKRLALYADELTHYLEKPGSASTSKTGYSAMPITASFDNAPSSDVLSNLTQTDNETTMEASTPLERYEAAITATRNIIEEWYNDYIRRFALYE